MVGAATRPVSLFKENERARISKVLEILATGQNAALISDAGTPAVSDPGAALVAAIAKAGYRCVPIVGASALAAALSVAGFEQAQPDILFLGFVAVKGRARNVQLAQIAERSGVVVVFESPRRIGALLTDVSAAAPDRPVCVCRELTKRYEELLRGSVSDLSQRDWSAARGEFTVAFGPLPKVLAAEVDADDGEISADLKRCIGAGLSKRDAARAVAAVRQLPKRRVYELLKALSGDGAMG